MKVAITWRRFQPGLNRRVHALECIMGNQGKVQRNSKVCKEVQNDEKYSRYAINFGLFIF